MTGKSGKNRKALTAGMTVRSALAEVVRSSFDSLTRWESKARSWDVEGVHQMRVNARRMRSASRSCRSAVGKEVSLHRREELRWLASQPGDARDLDAFIAMVAWRTREGCTLPASFEKRWQAFVHQRPSKISAGAERMVRNRR